MVKVIEKTSLDARFAEDDALTEAANAGDLAAESSYFQRNTGFLRVMAGKFAHGTMDPDDLVHDSVVRLLTRWREGTGPTSMANSYLLQSMRNRVIDEKRSRRFRSVTALDGEASLPAYVTDVTAIDNHREYACAEIALATLAADQQFVIRATVLEGRKPAELVDELDRTASAVYSLLGRAKSSLRRAMLIALLEDRAPVECRAAAALLPVVGGRGWERSAPYADAQHPRACQRCGDIWTRFFGE